MGSICLFPLSLINWQLTLAPLLTANKKYSLCSFPPDFREVKGPLQVTHSRSPCGAKELWVTLAVLEGSVCTCGQHFIGSCRVMGERNKFSFCSWEGIWCGVVGVADNTGKFFAFPAVEESVILCFMAKNLVGKVLFSLTFPCLPYKHREDKVGSKAGDICACGSKNWG